MTPPTKDGRAGGREVFAYFGHHKCASTWIMGILSTICAEIGLRHRIVLDERSPQATGLLTDYAETFDRGSLRSHIDAVGADFVTCLTADPSQAEVLSPTKAFHVIRDPRDIIVSAYFSHRNSHPTEGLPHLQAHRSALEEMSLEEGLLSEMEFSGSELRQMGDWDYTTEHILEVKAEDLTAHPYDGFVKVFRHLGLLRDIEPVLARDQMGVWMRRLGNRISRRPALHTLRRRIPATGEIILGTVYAQRFEAQTGGRQRGSEDVASHYRKGVAGDWTNYFTSAHIDAFNAKFGELPVRLGYEQDDHWRPNERLTR